METQTTTQETVTPQDLEVAQSMLRGGMDPEQALATMVSVARNIRADLEEVQAKLDDVYFKGWMEVFQDVGA